MNKKLALILGVLLMSFSNVHAEVSQDYTCNMTIDVLNETRWTCGPADVVNGTINDTRYNYTYWVYTDDPINHAYLKPVEAQQCIYWYCNWDKYGNPFYLTDGGYNSAMYIRRTSNMTLDIGEAIHLREIKVWTSGLGSDVTTPWISMDGENWTQVTNFTRYLHMTGTGYHPYFVFEPGMYETRYIRIYMARQGQSQRIREFTAHAYNKTEYTMQGGELTVTYQSVSNYDVLRNKFRVSNHNIALDQYAWGDGDGTEYLTDGYNGRKWVHNKKFGTGNWYGIIYPTTPPNATEGEIFPEIPPGSAVHVALPEITNIARVEFYPYMDQADFSYFGIIPSDVDYFVGISEDAVNWKWVAKGTVQNGGPKITHNIPAGITGKFVRIELVPKTSNGFYEVQGITEIVVNEYIEKKVNDNGNWGKDK